jgi:hypothetical protein
MKLLGIAGVGSGVIYDLLTHVSKYLFYSK